eukprot:6258807-Amphidinium_carterae.1
MKDRNDKPSCPSMSTDVHKSIGCTHNIGKKQAKYLQPKDHRGSGEACQKNKNPGPVNRTQNEQINSELEKEHYKTMSEDGNPQT